MGTLDSNSLVSVVIANHNRCDDLATALRSVFDQDWPRIEVIVVDNASHDDSRLMLESEYPNVRLIALDDNLAMAGYSVGFNKANGEIVFQMDNDSVLPDRSVLTEVAGRFLAAPRNLAVVAARVEEYRPDIDRTESLRLSDTRIGPIQTLGFHAGGVGFRRDILDQTSYYDRDVFLYGSELFLEMQFLALGYKIFYFPEILVLHRSSLTARSPLGIYFELRNRYWFMRRFANLRQRLRHLPAMLFHDLVYGLRSGDHRTLMRSLRDGFGPLPSALQGRVQSTNPQFTARVEVIGRCFGLGATLGRVVRQLRQ